MELLAPNGHTQHSPSRGDAHNFAVKGGNREVKDAAWHYPESPVEELSPDTNRLTLTTLDFSQTHHLADLAQTELFGKRCVFEKIGEAGRFVTLHVARTDIPQEVVIAGCWFLANYAA